MMLSTGLVPVRVNDPLRAVFDTNVVVSALLFPHGSVAWLREAWAREAIVPVVAILPIHKLVKRTKK